MKILYFDCFSGISGDMTVGALLDLGLDFDYLKAEIGKLPVSGFQLRQSRVMRANIGAAKFDVLVDGDPGHPHAPHEYALNDHRHHHAHHDDVHAHEHGHPHAAGTEELQADRGGHHHRRAAEILDMIRSSPLEARVRDRAGAIFEKLAISEGRVHRTPPEEVSFHEVGAIDSIVDIVGAAVGLEALGVERFHCSPINVGGGFIECQHGVYPIPAPATSNLLEGAPVYSKHVERELVTPTGAAILAATVDRFGPMENFEIERVGYGAGSRDLGAFPNCLRVFLGRESQPLSEPAADVIVIESNIDDMPAEELAYAAEKLMDAGALDFSVAPILMKKGRPGHLLQVVVRPGDEDRISRVMFEETTTIGVRLRPMGRRVLDRRIVEASTAHGPVRVKLSSLEGRIVRISPEYEDCARLARAAGVPFARIREEAVRLCRESLDREG